VRLKLDENLGRRWTDQLRSVGHDVDTVLDEGLSGAADGDVLAVAVQANRVLITLDLDFANPVRFPPAPTPGIAVLRVRERPERVDFDAVVSRLIMGLAGTDIAGRLWIVERDRVRQYEEPPD
jgi:predicted nuclease of predicted toxin-antitoxin system